MKGEVTEVSQFSRVLSKTPNFTSCTPLVRDGDLFVFAEAMLEGSALNSVDQNSEELKVNMLYD